MPESGAWRTAICCSDCDFLRMRKAKTAAQRILPCDDGCHHAVEALAHAVCLTHPSASARHPHLVHDDEGQRWDLSRTRLEQQVLGLRVRG